MDYSGDFLIKWAKKLGRSDEFIKALGSYVAKLSEMDFPVIFSPLHWAKMMNVSYDDLMTILDNREAYYDHFRIKKKKADSFRYIQAPTGELLKIQTWVKINILDKLVFGDHLTSYQKGKSIVDNALLHVDQEIVVNFDLESFFETITQDKIYGVFKIIGYNSSVAVELARACCLNVPQRIGKPYRDHPFACLPQGSPTSPGLSNLSAAMLDFRLLEYARSRGLNFSRYADDLTFSGKVVNKPNQSTIGFIASSEGFKLNAKKTYYAQSSCQQKVTGLNVNHKVSIPKKNRRKIDTHIHNCLRFGPFANMHRMGKFKMNYREWLLGNIVYIQMVHPEQGRRMREKFNRINWF
jgi:hypothetical protein